MGWIIDSSFPDPELSHRFDLQESVWLFSMTPDFICMLPYIFLPSSCFKMSQLMGAMFIECSETRVEASYSGLPVTEHVEISWTPDSVIHVWCFNFRINSLQYCWSWKMSSLSTELHMGLPFDRWSIADFGGKSWITVKILRVFSEWVQIIPPYFCTHIYLWESHSPIFNCVLSVWLTPDYHR